MSFTINTASQFRMPDTLKQTVRKWLALRFNRVAYLPTEDRRILETVILPNLSERTELHKILSVGCAWYSEGYERSFLKGGRAYWTIDIDRDMARFGASAGRHIVGDVQEVDRHFAPDSLDLVLCNGVFGWGLDDEVPVTRAFDSFFQILRPGGLFVLGWNDVSERRPRDPLKFADGCGFHPYTFEPLSGTQFLCDTENRHTYNFYVKPQGDDTR